MPLLPTELLKKLGSGVRPDGSHRRHAQPGPSIDFASLIASARAGEIRSDRPVRWEHQPDLESDERLRPIIEKALDRAEAAGVSRLLIAHGGRLLAADVAQRRISSIDPDGASVLAMKEEAVLFVSELEDGSAQLETLDDIESGTRSAKGNLTPGLGWITNRSLGEVVAASQTRNKR